MTKELDSIAWQLRNDLPLKEATKLVARMESDCYEFRQSLCRKHGHRKGAGAWAGVSYCTTCRGQIDNAEFRKAE